MVISPASVHCPKASASRADRHACACCRRKGRQQSHVESHIECTAPLSMLALRRMQASLLPLPFHDSGLPCTIQVPAAGL